MDLVEPRGNRPRVWSRLGGHLGSPLALPSGHVLVVTGDRRSGKTTACGEAVERARLLGLDCAGLLSPARLESGKRIGSDVLDVRTGERRHLTNLVPDASGRRFRHRFDPAGLAWGNERLGHACPAELLVVDELGPLELRFHQGWTSGLDILRPGAFGLAIVVVRPALLGNLLVTLRAQFGPLEGLATVLGPDELLPMLERQEVLL